MKKQLHVFYLLGFCLFLSVGISNAQSGNLIVYWNFDAEADGKVTDDIMGSEGILEGDASTGGVGIDGTALQLNGTSDYVSTDLLSEVQSASNLTVMAWFNPATLGGAAQHLLWIGNASGNGWGLQQELHISLNHWNAELQNDNISLFYGASSDVGDSSIIYYSTDAVLDLDEWFHVAGVFRNMDGIDGDPELELYLDGVLLTPTDWSGTTLGFPNSTTTSSMIDRDAWDTPFRIGASGSTTTRLFNGLIDEVRIYDGPLTPTEIVLASEMEELPGVSSITDTELRNNIIYPNPSDGVMYISDVANYNSIKIFDLEGREVVGQTNELESAINLSHLKSGVYLIKLEGLAYSHLQKIIIQ